MRTSGTSAFARLLHLVVLLALACSPGMASALQLGDSEQALNLSAQLLYYDDAGRALDLPGARRLHERAGAFVPRRVLLERGRAPAGAMWAVLELEYTGAQPRRVFHLRQADTAALDVQWHVVSPTGEVLSHRLGGLYPGGSRIAPSHRPFVLELTLERHQPVRVYLRSISPMASVDGFRLGVWLHSLEPSLQLIQMGYLTLGLIYGTLSALALYNLVVFAVTRMRALGYYSAQQVFIILLLLSVDGTGFHHLWPQAPAMQYAFSHLWAGLIGLFALLTTDALCGVRKRYPLSALGVLLLAIATPWISLAAALRGEEGWLVQLAFTASMVGLLQMLLMFSMVVRLVLDRVRYGLPLLVCQLVWLAGTLTALMSYEHLSSLALGWLLVFGIHLGALGQAVLQSTVIAQKIRLDQCELQQALRERLSATDQANTLKQQFLNMIGHEFRTPLSGIQGSLEILSERQNEESRPWLKAALHSTRRITKLVDDVMLFSDLQSRQLKSSPAPVALQALILELEQFVAGRFVERAGQFRCAVRGEVYAVVIDARLLLIALRQLVDNAFKYSSRPQVELRFEFDRQHQRLEVTLEDNGCGMGGDVSRLLDSFAQGESGFARSHEGLGLGLTIASSAVQAMGGQMLTGQRAGGGTRVQLSLPAAAAPASVALASPPPAGSVGQLRILVVEDNPVSQAIIRRQLLSHGCSVTLAADGQDAVARFAEGEYDCVLMDCQMPRMDGFEASRQIRAMEPPDRHVPIIAVTANTLQGDRERARDAGMDDFLGKPYSGDELHALILRHVGADVAVPV